MSMPAPACALKCVLDSLAPNAPPDARTAPTRTSANSVADPSLPDILPPPITVRTPSPRSPAAVEIVLRLSSYSPTTDNHVRRPAAIPTLHPAGKLMSTVGSRTYTYAADTSSVWAFSAAARRGAHVSASTQRILVRRD